MRVGELTRQTGVSVRALRYYERVGLLVPRRRPNGYRDYDRVAVQQVNQIRALTSLGFSVAHTRPFVECLAEGHGAGDECPESMAAYKRAIGELSERIALYTRWREVLTGQLEAAACRVISNPGSTASGLPIGVQTMTNWEPASLLGMPMPGSGFVATDGSAVRLDSMGPVRTVLFVYPLTGRPGEDLPEGWETIPGARGCTAEACGFRDHHRQLLTAGVSRVYGLSAQSTAYQQELGTRLGLPYPVLSDPGLTLARTLGLPTFRAGGHHLFRRITLLIVDAVIEHVWYPIPAPGDHPNVVLAWLRQHREHRP